MMSVQAGIVHSSQTTKDPLRAFLVKSATDIPEHCLNIEPYVKYGGLKHHEAICIL